MGGGSGLDAAAVNAAALAGAAAAEGGPAAVGEGMRGAHMLVWLGDFNYRIDGPYEAVKERAIRNELGVLADMVGPLGTRAGLWGCDGGPAVAGGRHADGRA